MSLPSRNELLKAWQALPESMRYRRASERDVTAFEAEYQPIPEAFRWFLLSCGGGVIGHEWIDGIEQLPATHRKFRAEAAQENGWKMQGVFVIGWDGTGNPIAIQAASGAVVVEDHQFGGVQELAISFEYLLAKGLANQ